MTEQATSPRAYVGVFVGLLTLTLATTLVAYVDLDQLSVVAALLIAGVKAGLVAAYFMHLRHSSGLTRLFVGAGIFWLALLITLTLADSLTRPWIPPPAPWQPGS